METNDAVAGFSALAHSTRIAAVRLLVQAEPHGIASGVLAERLGVRPNTMSANLSALAQAGVAVSERRGKSVIYRANLPKLKALIGFLVEDCCGGDGDACEAFFAGALEAAATPTPMAAQSPSVAWADAMATPRSAE